jgi:hypothetical protein
MIMGTSTTRGIFWQLMDMVSPPVLGANISNTQLWKCWGVLDYTIGNLRITYRDFRWHYPDTMLVSDNYRNATYTELGEAWLHQNVCPELINWTDPLCAQDGCDWANVNKAHWFGKRIPDVIVVEDHEAVPNSVYLKTDARRQCFAAYEKGGGKIIRISTKSRTPEETGAAYAKKEAAHSASAVYNKLALDVVPMAIPLFNRGRGIIGNEFHFIQQCDGGHGRHVCGDVLEMEVIWVVHVLFQALPHLNDQLMAGMKSVCGVKQMCDKWKATLWKISTVNKLPNLYKQAVTCAECPHNFAYITHNRLTCNLHIPMEL